MYRLGISRAPDRPEHLDNPTPPPVFSMDTPPPTVSGFLHLGHVYSYSHADFIARFRRMNGDNVYYPMGFDDNGLPTERLVERLTGKTAEDIGRAAFIGAAWRPAANTSRSTNSSGAVWDSPSTGATPTAPSTTSPALPRNRPSSTSIARTSPTAARHPRSGARPATPPSPRPRRRT